VTAQKRSECDAVGVPDTFGDFIDRLVARLQQMDRTLDPQGLEVGQGRLSQYRVHSTRERAFTRRYGFRRFIQ
jgi:hypothetical protein